MNHVCHSNAQGFICNHVLQRESKPNLVIHGPDGSWCFLCGEEHIDHENADKVHLICIGCAFQDFVDGLSKDDIPLGFEAERSSAEMRWVVKPMSQEDIAEYIEEH